VDPAAVGAGELGVDEEGVLLEGFDASAPAEGNAVEAKLVVDEGTRPHRDGLR
jgi:hypothetical protein